MLLGGRGDTCSEGTRSMLKTLHSQAAGMHCQCTIACCCPHLFGHHLQAVDKAASQHLNAMVLVVLSKAQHRHQGCAPLNRNLDKPLAPQQHKVKRAGLHRGERKRAGQTVVLARSRMLTVRARALAGQTCCNPVDLPVPATPIAPLHTPPPLRLPHRCLQLSQVPAAAAPAA